MWYNIGMNKSIDPISADNIIYHIEELSESELHTLLSELELLLLAKYIKRKFSDENRSLQDIVEIIKDEFKINAKVKKESTR